MSRRQSVPLNMFLRAADPMPPLFDAPHEGDFYFNTTFNVVRIYRKVLYSDPPEFSWQDLTTGGSAELGKDTTWTFVGPNDPGDPTLLGNPDGLSTPLWIDTDSGIDEGGGTGGGGGGGHIIQDEGVPLAARPGLNFVGALVTATDDAANNRTDVVVTGTPSPVRTTVSVTTASLAAGAGGTGTVPLAIGYRLYAIACSSPCRVRLYTTAAKRDADVSRPVGTDPVLDHGVMLEFFSDPTLLSADLSPVVDGFDGETDPYGSVPYHITNLDSVTRAITVTLSWIRTE